jgi:hypothetical protein
LRSEPGEAEGRIGEAARLLEFGAPDAEACVRLADTRIAEEGEAYCVVDADRSGGDRRGLHMIERRPLCRQRPLRIDQGAGLGVAALTGQAGATGQRERRRGDRDGAKWEWHELVLSDGRWQGARSGRDNGHTDAERRPYGRSSGRQAAGGLSGGEVW